ncbi:MAG: hypothetical protein AAF577_11675 [Pseudomonadota bacterium]
MRLATILFCLSALAAQPALAQLAGGGGGGGGGGTTGAGPLGGGGAGFPAGFTPSSDFVAQGGLSVRILFVGRSSNGKDLTISTQIVNSGEQPLNAALIGPEPTAIDNFGVQYSLTNIAGIGRCKNLSYDWVSGCMSHRNGVLSNAHFAHLQPGATTIMALTFSTEDKASEAGFMSISMNFAVGVGERVTDDNRGELRNFPITFPIIDLAAATTGQ